YHHAPPRYQASMYESLNLSSGRRVLRVFTPLREVNGSLTGYFEGVRLVPAWQRKQILVDSLTVALMVGLASLLCGGVLYPVVIRLSSENQRKAQEVLESHISMMEALGRAIAKRDSNTGAHNYRVAWISATLAETLGIKGDGMQALIAGSFLHDAGKIGIPDAILLKPGKLTDDEMDLMRTHVAMGEEIITGGGWLDGAREVVACHHEKWDGSGYPRGLVGEAIPLVARMFAIVDVFDALCSKRPYKDPLPLNEVMDVLQKGSGIHFDPTLLKVFSSIASKVYEATIHASEAEVRALMTKMVRRHFGN
ncbi:MAG: HD-GYP domain-containing protein, partial [Proteobacteria bacterium]|nr:HD-GYP domain-containing protein [Pseudomonadota bacterium]